MRFPYKGAGIALINNDSVFLGKRSKRPFKNSWAVPGGGFEKDKDNDYLSTAIREMKEETSININFLKAEYLGFWQLKMPFFCWTTFYFYYEGEFNNLKLDEMSQAKWVRYKDIKKLKKRPFCSFEIKKAVRLIKSQSV